MAKTKSPISAVLLLPNLAGISSPPAISPCGEIRDSGAVEEPGLEYRQTWIV